MRILRAYKTELDPNNKQCGAFMKHSGVARFVYNWALADRIEQYENGEKTSLFEQKRRFNALKHEQYPWIQETAYCVTEQAFRNLDAAYQNFFRRVKEGREEKGFPKFKSRKRGIGSFTMRGCIHLEYNRIKLPRIGWVRLKEGGYLPTDGVKILSVNISERAGRWYASVQVEMEVPDPEPGQGDPIGVDFGIKTLAVCSDGTTFENPKAMEVWERKLKRLQRELARRKKGGKNREKTKRKIAKCHAKIANIRKHALHNVSYHVTAKTKPSTVVVEDLNVKGMMANHCLAKGISDASFGELRREIEYKGEWYGVDVVTAGRFYPSSKTCSGCGSVRPLLKLSERTFVCEECGMVVDRDLNAALNLASLVSSDVKAETQPDCLGS
jgi:putative transposase